jgi:hypothetical protein
MLLLNSHDALAVIGNHAEKVLHVPVPDIDRLIGALSQTLFHMIDTTTEAMQSRLIQQDSNQSQNRGRCHNHPELKLRHNHPNSILTRPQTSTRDPTKYTKAL